MRERGGREGKGEGEGEGEGEERGRGRGRERGREGEGERGYHQCIHLSLKAHDAMTSIRYVIYMYMYIYS